jgi:hypothetical protein
MSVRTLDDIEASIEHLDLQDQIRLLQYLTPKIAEAVLISKPKSGMSDAQGAWRRYRALGDRLSDTSTAEAANLTNAVSQLRR